jgi:hypothetical protein
VALAGRVHVKVTGDVSVGDMLTSSELAGVAMKATQAGIVVGMALDEPFVSGSQQYVMAFVRPQYWAPSVDIGRGAELEEFENSSSFVRSLFEELVALFAEIFNISFQEGTIKTNQGEFNQLKTDVLCLDDLCVTKDQLRELMNAGEIAPADIVPEPEPTPTPEPTESTEPQPTDTPEPTPEPEPEPTSIPEPGESSETEPTEFPEPASDIEPENGPEPTPSPEPTPESSAEPQDPSTSPGQEEEL